MYTAAFSSKRTTGGSGRVLIALVIVASIVVSMMTTEWLALTVEVSAQGVPQFGSLPQGEITAVGSATLDVAGRFYGLHPKLTIVNDEGKSMELKQLKPGLIIQYHVKEGALDQIIVLMTK